MDDSRFDALTRALFAAGSRRQALAAAVGGLGTLLGVVAATDAKKKKKKKKKKTLSPALPPSPPPPPPGPPPPVVCPPVCPICQGCNAATGLCEGHPSQQGQPAPGCAAPRVCCGGSCCELIHECNSAGTCTTCAQACPAEFCTACVHLADDSTRCAFDVGSRCDLNELCATDADCPGFRPLCMTSFTDRGTNVTSQICGQPVGSGVCVDIGGCGA